MFFSATTTKYLHSLLLFLAVSVFFAACTSIRHYSTTRPFVYQTNIEVSGNYTTTEKKNLLAQLDEQLHDSLRVRNQRKFLFWHTIDRPAVFDSGNVSKSIAYMGALLNSLGYYRDSITFTDTVKVVDDQRRAYVNFNVMPGKRVHLDSIWYNLADSVPPSRRIDTLQALTTASLNQKLIRKGDPFSKPLISAELDRLSDVYRNNGYLRFSRELLLAVWDTVGINLLTVDPTEQLAQLEALRRRRENPTADLEIRLVPQPDTSRLLRYYVGQVRIYPDFDADTSYYTPHEEILAANRYQFISYRNLFKPRKLIRFIYLERGDLFQQRNVLRTQNKFSSLAWRSASVTPLPRAGQDTVDFDIKLVPAKKYLTRPSLDISRNQSNLATDGNNLLGFGATFSLINRNFARSAAQASTNLRYGIELASRIDSIQTQQFTFTHTIQFPRLVPRMQWLPREWREGGRTFLNFNAGYTDRIRYYNVVSFNTSWGYEFNFNHVVLGLRFPNIEYNFVHSGEDLKNLILTNASYKYIFNEGLIISGLVTANWVTGKANHSTVKRGGLELSGLPGFLQLAFPNAKMYHFAKLDAEVVQTFKIRRTAFAWRAFAGIGYAIPFTRPDGKVDSNNLFMPFFRQYFAGGPNSMRAWAVRELGPGSSIKSFDRSEAPDRFGDVRLEVNAEYRYYISQLFGFNLEGALFTDIGNVWFRRQNNDFPNGEFKLSRLPKDLAVGVGTGFRIDFGFLKARFDFAWKAKDPSPGPADAYLQNKWFYKLRLLPGDANGRRGAQFQLGINYPF